MIVLFFEMFFHAMFLEKKTVQHVCGRRLYMLVLRIANGSPSSTFMHMNHIYGSCARVINIRNTEEAI